MLDFPVLIGIQIIWILVAIFWLVRRNDALPLVANGLLFYVFGFRLWAMLAGLAAPVNLSPFGFENLSYGSAIQAFNLEVLGQTVLVSVYLWYQKASFVTARIVLKQSQGAWLRLCLVVLTLFCVPVVFVTRAYTAAQAASGLSIGFEVSSYAYLFPFVLNSLAILTVSLWKAGEMPGPLWKLFGVGLLASVAYLSFGSSGRFLFLGWMLATVFIAITGLPTVRRLLILSGGISLTLTLFGVAGALRSEDKVADVGLQQSAWERVFSAEDANMLDGFVLLRQVYPEMLPHTYGGEHLGVLLRPIPRALWPGKPVGTYMNQLGLIDASDGFTLGISPSLFGDFYQEGGWLGVVILSLLYGRGLAWLVSYSARVQSFAGMSIRVILYAFMIPLLRGGDLPGIYAWLGMAFWPYLFFFWMRRGDWLSTRQQAKSVFRPVSNRSLPMVRMRRPIQQIKRPPIVPAVVQS